jgi:hypothetical protein
MRRRMLAMIRDVGRHSFARLGPLIVAGACMVTPGARAAAEPPYWQVALDLIPSDPLATQG